MQKIGDLMKMPEIPRKKENRIHSERHDLADQLCKHFKEPKKFAFWLGVIRRYGKDEVYRQWRGLSDYTKPFTPGLLLWKLKDAKQKRTAGSKPDNHSGQVQGKENRPAS